MKYSREKLLFPALLLGSFFFFPLALAEELTECRFLEETVKSDGTGISFFDRRAFSLFQGGQLQNGEAKIFLEKNRNRLSGECLISKRTTLFTQVQDKH